MSFLNAAKVTTTLGLVLPSFATASRPTGESGLVIYNSTTRSIQIFANSRWNDVVTSSSQFIVQLWGAGGGGGTVGGWSFGAAGGGGGYAYGEVSGLTSGASLILQVGQGGIVNGGSVSFGGGGQANRTGSDNRYGSNGGGYSGLFLGSVSQANAIMIAGGGGGGGSSRANVGNFGGAGGGDVGQDGQSPYENKIVYRGRGGGQGSAPDQAASDADNTNVPGQALLGGTSRVNGYGGAGGGGYFGGSAGGYSESNTMAGGGGGSGYINTTYVRNGLNERGEYRSNAGGGAAGYPGGGIGLGGLPASTGGNGFARILNTTTGATTTYSYSGNNVTIVVP
jgi:hypothetical protein